MLGMMALDAAAVADLKDLVRINTDSARGLRKAAREVQNQRLAGFLRRNADERERFAVELKTLLRMSDEDAEALASVRGAVPRWWLGLRGLVAGGDEDPVLAEAQQAEEAIQARYESVLERAGDNPVCETLIAHCRSIDQTLSRIGDLRRARVA